MERIISELIEYNKKVNFFRFAASFIDERDEKKERG